MSGQVAVVTGAGRGIGREVAVLFGQLGAKVVVAEISEAAGAETARLIEGQGGKAHFTRTDVSDAGSVEQLARRTEQLFGPADVLVNGAILSPVVSVQDMDIDLWDRVTAVNLRGTFLTCKAFLPGMLKRDTGPEAAAKGGGVIVNMTSLDAMPFMSAYMATKQGIVGFTRSLAAELEGSGSGVRAIAFVPGVVDTPGLREAIGCLGPALGMSPDEFFRSALPAGRAALATAHLVLRYAGDYHGEVVDGYTILERVEGAETSRASASGSIASGGASAGAGAGGGAAVGTTPVGAGSGSTTVDAAVSRATEAAQVLVAILAETEAELQKLPIFVRPMARAGFKDKAGLSIKEWTVQVKSLTDRLASVGTAGGVNATGDANGTNGDNGDHGDLRATLPGLIQRLPQLASYYRGVPAQTARFSKDQAFLTMVKKTSEEREGAVEALRQALLSLSSR